MTPSPLHQLEEYRRTFQCHPRPDRPSYTHVGLHTRWHHECGQLLDKGIAKALRSRRSRSVCSASAEVHRPRRPNGLGPHRLLRQRGGSPETPVTRSVWLESAPPARRFTGHELLLHQVRGVCSASAEVHRPDGSPAGPGSRLLRQRGGSPMKFPKEWRGDGSAPPARRFTDVLGAVDRDRVVCSASAEVHRRTSSTRWTMRGLLRQSGGSPSRSRTPPP